MRIVSGDSLQTGPAYRLYRDSQSGPATVRLVVTDDSGRVVGEAVLRVGEPWQLTSFVVELPDATVAAALCHVIVQTLRLNRARGLAVSVEAPGRGFLTRVGLFPAARSVAELLDQQRRANPEGYRLVSQGQGLNDVELPYPAELLTAPLDATALAG